MSRMYGVGKNDKNIDNFFNRRNETGISVAGPTVCLDCPGFVNNLLYYYRNHLYAYCI